MRDRDDRPADGPRAASALHWALLKIGVPRFMADHSAALLAALLPDRRRGKDEPPDR